MHIHGSAVPGMGNAENKTVPSTRGPHLVEEGVEQSQIHVRSAITEVSTGSSVSILLNSGQETILLLPS